MLSHFSHIWLLVTLWTVTCPAPLSMGFSGQEHWRGLPFPSPTILKSFLKFLRITVCFSLCLLLLFSHKVMSHCLWPCGLQYTRPLCPSPSPEVCPSSCPLNQWYHPTISFSVAHFSFCLQSFPASRSFSVKWPEYWSISFSISPSNEYSGLISFRMDWLDLRDVQGTQDSSLTPQFKSIDSSMVCLLYGTTLPNNFLKSLRITKCSSLCLYFL